MMLQKIILQSTKNSSDKGFLTIEVIIATLVAFFFLMFSIQALASAMLMKVQAQQDQRADQLIQEDIERLGSLSSTLPNTIDCNAPTYANGYAQALWDSLDDLGTPLIHEGNETVTTSLLSNGGGVVMLGLSRTHLTVNPHRTLKIFYQVTNSNNDVDNDLDVFGDADDVIVATRYVEIIPDEALRCP